MTPTRSLQSDCERFFESLSILPLAQVSLNSSVLLPNGEFTYISYRVENVSA